MEQRKFTRINIVSSVDIYSINEKMICKGVITNISAGGVGIIAAESLEVGTDVKLSFKANKELSFDNIKGIVVRTELIGNQYFAFIGVNFLNVDPEKKTELGKLIMEKRNEQQSFR